MKRLIFLLLITTQVAFGQADDSTASVSITPKSDFKYGLIGDFGFAPTATLLPTIRSFFRDNQIRSDGSLTLFLNFGFGVRLRRLKLLAQNGFGLKNARAYSELPATGSESVAQNSVANYTGLLVGYDVVNSRNRRLYINVGLGGMEYGFNIFRRTNQTVPFQSVLQTGQTGTLSSLLLRNVGYVDVNLEYAQREKRKRSIEYVIRLGYRSGTYAKAYESDAFLLIDAPRDRIGQIYLQTSLSLSANNNKWKFR